MLMTVYISDKMQITTILITVAI